MFYFIVFVILNVKIDSILSDCSIDIQKELPQKDALLVTNNGKLWSNLGPQLILSNSDKAYAICTGSGNSFVNASGSEASLQCKNKIKVNNGSNQLSDTECTTTITGDVKITNNNCSKYGSLFLIGFNTKKFGFIEYIKVCYNSKKASVIYTEYEIYGKSIDYAISDNLRPVFKITGIPKNVKPIKSYKQISQLNRFTELLESEELARKYINKTSFLARGHLTPDKDGLFRTWQYSTYFYINVAPEWQIINSGNWLRVENIARKVASSLKNNLKIYTGVFGILTLPNIHKIEVKISLETGGNIIVPKWYWKILKYENKGIAFITLNNPFAKKIEHLCENICENYGWKNEAFNDITKGYTYCCAVNKLLKVIKNDAPKNIHVTEVLFKSFD